MWISTFSFPPNYNLATYFHESLKKKISWIGFFCTGGWDSCQALEQIRRHSLSVALFAPGWIVECFPQEDPIEQAMKSAIPSSPSGFFISHEVELGLIMTAFRFVYWQEEKGWEWWIISLHSEPCHFAISFQLNYVTPCPIRFFFQTVWPRVRVLRISTVFS